jgi:hypothetical protein
MLEYETKIQDKKNFHLIEILLSIIQFFPNLTISIWEKIKNIFRKKGENSNKKQLIVEEKEKENDYNKFNADYNDNDNYNNTYIDVKSIAQIQASKQKLKQLESQTYSNRTMARLISTAELYALAVKCKNRQLYKKFDEFDNLNRKTIDELKGELILQIGCFKVSYQSYIKKYKHYDFPDDYDEEKTLEELKDIEQNIHEKDKKYYQAIIKLLNGDTNIPSFDDDLEELEEGEPDTKDPILQIKTDIPIMRHLDGIRKNLKQNYLEDPMNCKVKLNLDEPMEKNEELKKLVKKLDKEKNKKKEVQKKYRSLSANFSKYKRKDNNIEKEINYNRKNSSSKLLIKSVESLHNEDKDEDIDNKENHSNCYCDSNCSNSSDYEDMK